MWARERATNAPHVRWNFFHTKTCRKKSLWNDAQLLNITYNWKTLSERLVVSIYHGNHSRKRFKTDNYFLYFNLLEGYRAIKANRFLQCSGCSLLLCWIVLTILFFFLVLSIPKNFPCFTPQTNKLSNESVKPFSFPVDLTKNVPRLPHILMPHGTLIRTIANDGFIWA